MLGTPVLPVSISISPDRIPVYKANQHKTNFEGCTQINQIFVKANGQISCSCMRYYHVLANARETNVAEFFNGDLMRYIRQSFQNGCEPFVFCKGCASRHSKYNKFSIEEQIISLHIEPSNQCNLFCEVCTCTDERLSENTPPRLNLDFETYEKLLGDISGAKLNVAAIALVGFGEPLFNSRTPDMARAGRRLFPNAHIYLDTNANFGEKRARELADCGLNEIRLGLDGSDQASYSTYRKNGNFAKALGFARALASAVREKGSSTRVIWKYILFRHNDRDEQILAAVKMAEEIGIPIIFDATGGELASKRALGEIQRLVGDRKFGCNIDLAAIDPEHDRLPRRTS